MIEVGGRDINGYLQKLLKDRKVMLELEDCRKLKEVRGALASDYEKEIDSYKMGLVKNNFYWGV